MVQSLFRPWWRLSWLSCLLCAWLCAASAEPADEPDKPQDFSYALFLQRPRPLTQDMLVQAAARAWELELPAAQKLKISVSAGTGKVRFQGVTFQITMEGTPWLHDQNDFIQATPDRQMRAMLRLVKAHLAVTIANKFKSDEARDDATDHQLRLAAALIDKADTLAIYDDDTGDFNYPDDEVLAALTGEDPHSAFEIAIPPAPPTANSPALQAATAEAKRRWPEFAKSFRDFSDTRGPYLIQAIFPAETPPTWHWCELVNIQAGKITAILRSPSQPRLTKGEQIEFPLQDLTDWTYPNEDGERIGAWTVDPEE